MSDTTASRLREDYLTRLDTALRDVPHGLAMEIREGIAEELQGDDADLIRERLVRLGEPEAIAAEARRADPSAPTVVRIAPAASVPMTRRTSFAVVAALVLGFGTFVIPIAGWVIGVVLVAYSTRWRRAEKVWAVVSPFAIATLFCVAALVTSAFQSGSGAQSGDAPNPLLPAAFDLAWSGVFLVAFIAIPVSGLWLLWRLRDRRSATARS